MGLDQSAFAVMPHKDNTDFVWAWTREEAEKRVVEIAYWRKHPDLRGWMEQLWLSKMEAAGIPPQPEEEGWFAGHVVFNCQPVRVTFQDLEDLEQAVNGNGLPHTTGFFFGQTGDWHLEPTLEFIKKAREAIAQDMEIYYTSWW